MNASDIIKSKQNATIYKSYYKYATSSVKSTLYTISSNNGISSIGSCNYTIYEYPCNQPFMTYELANDVNKGKYACGAKTVTQTIWKADPSIPTQNIYAFSSYSTPSSIKGASTILSVNSHAVRPMICNNPFNQGNNICNVCNNFGAGVNASCYNCAPG